jgi:hypothetical protein
MEHKSQKLVSDENHNSKASIWPGDRDPPLDATVGNPPPPQSPPPPPVRGGDDDKNR